MLDVAMSVIGDCHLGAARRNKWLYDKSHKAFKTIIDSIGSNKLAIAGDLWDIEAPKPYDLVFAQSMIDKPTTTIIPGNHDRILVDGACAANVLNEAFVYMKPTTENLSDELVIHYIPYTTEISESLKDHTTNFNFNDGKKHILISHFSFIEVIRFVNGMSESDPIFNPYYQVIVADSHVRYDHGKFHTTGATYMNTIDEMYSQNSIPSYVNIMADGSITRVTFDEWKPQIINSEIEAVDDSQLYLIVTNDPIPITKQNVFVKYKGKYMDNSENNINLDINESVSLSSGGINKNTFFATVYPNMSKKDLQKLINFESGIIDVDELITDRDITKKDDGSKDEAILNNLLKDDFSF